MMDDQNNSQNSDLRRPEIISLIADRVNELRKRLLDSSRRNPLVNIHFKSNVIRVVDELPDNIRENLVSGKRMRFASLPALEEELRDEQTDAFLDALHLARQGDETFLVELEALDPSSPAYAEQELKAERALKDRLRETLDLPRRQTKDNLSLIEHAKAHGISPSYILPTPDEEHDDGRHEDLDIQTLMLPEKLTRVAKSLLEKGRSFERETGVNVLHAAFGLLDWKAPGEKDGYLSPLLLLEVSIERNQSKQGVEFNVRGEGNFFVNTTLKQKLLSEHRLELPEFETGLVEDYFRQIATAAPKGWEWSLRREVAFGIFPSSKIAMYHDLDPGKRPLAENPIVGRLLATSGSGDGAYAEVYGTDFPEVARKVPYLVMDADASQFSALADVADGKDLSIEGPPGSGKSQTIVNLIASALAGGKKVLFVAEKLTALDVVKNRLEAARLGEFILPLQAGSGTREKVFESIDERLDLEHADKWAQHDFASQQQALERQRSVLQGYLDALGSDFGSSGFTVYEVVGNAIATSDIRERVPKEVRRIRLPHAESMGKAQIGTVVTDAEAFAERLNKTARMPALWLDARASVMNRDDAEDMGERASELADRVEAFREEAASAACRPLFGEDIFTSDLARLDAMFGLMAAQGEKADAALVKDLLGTTERRAAEDLCTDIGRHRLIARKLSETLARPEDERILERLEAALAFAQKKGMGIAPERHRRMAGELSVQIAAMEETIAAARRLPGDWKSRGALSLLRVQSHTRSITGTAPEIRSQRRGVPAGHAARDLHEKFARAHGELSTRLGEIRGFLPKAGRHDPKALLQAADTIASSGVLRVLSSAFRSARQTYQETLGGSPSDARDIMTRRLRDYAAWLRDQHQFERDPVFMAAYGELFRGLDSNTDKIRELSEFQALCATIAAGEEPLRVALETGDLGAVEAFAGMNDIPDMSLDALTGKLEHLRAERDREEKTREGAEAHLSLFRGRQFISAAELEDIIAEKQREADLVSRIKASPMAVRLGPRFDGPATDIDLLQAEAEIARAVAGSANVELSLATLEDGRAGELRGELSRLSTSRASLEAEASRFAHDLDLPETRACLTALAARVDDLRIAAADPLSLMERGRLGRSEEALRGHGLGLLVDWALKEGQDITPEDMGQIARSVIAKSMADRAYEIHAARMRGYDGEDFDRIRAEIAAKDRELIRISRDVVRSRLILEARPPVGNGIGRKSEYTQMSLVHNELNKKRNRLGVRALTSRAGRALLELKPCWMMSPLAVAQYLPGELQFDLVVIDEASQMTPENAIGALSRGRQAVVVGDTKQLPPTTFFQKMIDESDADEDTREDSESILDMANMVFRPVRQLRWHYRSRHSALIRFSNEWMYDNKLTIFPSAHEDDPDMGVELVQLDGVYKGRTNETEARAVVGAVLRHMRETPHLSLGVCTMNSDQRELILEEFERERERNPHVQDYVRDWEEQNNSLEEFFIKNLETIQGDERDVMFISTLYGPETPGGRPHQRFGPINSVHGHRRLNVLFTRAKRKIVTFTSLRPSDIVADETKNRGVRMLRAWLEYCGSGIVPDRKGAGGQTESPFEDFVVQRIEAMGYEAVPQVGAQGYRIDIGVRHPEWPYGYILGVECDGAAYHSSKSSRERDRLRQEVLEGLGWHFHRIWSTDWFNDPFTQTEKLQDAIKAAHERAKSSPRPSGHRLTQPATTVQEIAPLRTEQKAAGPAARRNQPNLFPDLQDGLFAKPKPARDKSGASAAGLDDKVICLGSKVRIESLPQGRKLAFRLVKNSSNLDQGELSIFSPLGQALLGAREGDEIEYEVGVEVKEARVLSVTAR